MYTSISALSLLGARDALNDLREETAAYVMRCANFDGGFGADIGAESHAAQGILSRCHIYAQLDFVD